MFTYQLYYSANLNTNMLDSHLVRHRGCELALSTAWPLLQYTLYSSVPYTGQPTNLVFAENRILYLVLCKQPQCSDVPEVLKEVRCKDRTLYRGEMFHNDTTKGDLL